MYIIRDRKTEEIIFDSTAPLNKDLKGEDIYPDFDPEAMELLKTDINFDIVANHYDDFLKCFDVDKDGYIVEKSFEDKLKNNAIKFGEELVRYIEYNDKEHTEKPDNVSFKIVKLGLQHNLIKSIAQCEEAFLMLDKEIEARIVEKYRLGYEMKLLKGYTAWIDDGRPENDEREERYLKMNQNIEEIKEEYKPVRDELKKILAALEN